jgi:hypothetical protein
VSATSVAPRITRLALLAVAAATVLSVAACGTSNNQNAGKPTSSARATSSAPPSPPSAPPARIDHVAGMISSVSGDTINLKLRQGTATVDFTPSTKITEVSSAQLSDVTTGSCVKVEPGQASDGGAPTAQSVPQPSTANVRRHRNRLRDQPAQHRRLRLPRLQGIRASMARSIPFRVIPSPSPAPRLTATPRIRM